MEAVSPQLVQAIAAARVALTEAFVLKVGQTLEALVAGKSSDGLTLLRIGNQTVKAALPEGLPPGTTLQLLVKSAGPAPQLAIVAQTPPEGRVTAPAVLAQPIAATPTPVAEAPPTVGRVIAAQNSESRPAVVPTASQIESMPAGSPGPVQGPRPAVAQVPEVTSRASTPQTAGATVARAAVTGVAELPALPRAAGGPVVPPPTTAQAEARPIVPGPIPPAVAVRQVVTTAPAASIVPPGPPELGPVVPAPVPPASLAAEARPVPPSPAIVASAAAQSGLVADSSEPELSHPLLVAQAAPRPPATLAELPRPAVVATPTPTAQSVAPAQPPLPTTPQAALSQMLPESLAKQDSAGPLLQSLATLVQKPEALPEPVLRTALAVLAQRIVTTNGKVQPAELERAVLRSGLGLEATLAKGEAPVPLDAKAGLLALRAAMTKWLGEAPPPAAQREAAPPPLKGLTLRAPDVPPAPLPDAPRDALRAVHGQADAAVSRLKLMQMASLPDSDPGRPTAPALRLELPLLIGHELVMAQLQISRDASRREVERKRGWTMRFALNFSATGEVGAEVGLLGKAVNVALWAAEPDTAEAMQASLAELGEALEAVGLKPGRLKIRHGVPQPEKPTSGQLLDSTS